jgi:hypothetical protein
MQMMQVFTVLQTMLPLSLLPTFSHPLLTNLIGSVLLLQQILSLTSMPWVQGR